MLPPLDGSMPLKIWLVDISGKELYIPFTRFPLDTHLFSIDTILVLCRHVEVSFQK